MNRKTHIAIILLIIASMFLVTTTIAFITRSITIDSIITFGNLKMQLIETTIDENNIERQVANNEVLDITHHSNVSRIVKVKNVGNHEFFARVSLDMIGIDENNKEFDANYLVSYDLNTQDWIYQDNWYYYKKTLKENEITTNLITQVKFDINNIMTNYSNGKFKFNINAEVVQTENNADNVLDAVGWPSA